MAPGSPRPGSAAPIAPIAALALAGCFHQVPAPAPAPAPAAPAADAAAASWPERLEFELAEHSDVVKHGGLAMFSVETSLPVFHSDPPAIAAALNARIARLGKPDVDPRTHEGSYTIDCSVELANRYAVILDCAQHLEERPHDDADDEGPSAAPAEERRLTFGWWLRRGLPDLSLEQFAPRYDLRAAVDAAVASQPPGCDLAACAFDPRSFLFDSEGLTLVPTEDCSAMCDAAIPSIPLDELAPAHAWAEELVKRVRRRVEAGDLLVEGDRAY
ncbi:MAG TPA: hypothetical protein VK932_03855 [Kofleriaceae bacterium]|nr:hypothetical protein [Kofleriaceae bacterium]